MSRKRNPLGTPDALRATLPPEWLPTSQTGPVAGIRSSMRIRTKPGAISGQVYGSERPM